MKGGRAQETMNDALITEKQRYRDRWKKETSRFPMQLFLPCMSDIAPCRIRLCFMTLLVLCSITRSSWSINSIGYSEWKRTFSNSNIEDDILLDNRTGQIHKDMGEIMTSWLESGPTPCRVLAWTWALLGQMADICKTTTIWLDDRREPKGTLGWEWMMCKHYLGKSIRVVKQTRKCSCSSSLREQ
jgi:hypothetical protein